MANQVPWNKIILEEFIRLAALTKDEEMIMRTRVSGWSRTRQAMELGMSIATIDRHIKRLKEKYDKVQKYSALLPPRKSSDAETWMDTH